MKTITLSEFVSWVQGKTVVSETEDHDMDETYRKVKFSDGTEARLSCDYEGPYSEYTPGMGLGHIEIRVTA